jgi:succinyl-CoA:acetate CoA-transferase
MSAEQAAALISSGDNVGMSGFTGSGYPKAVPHALARRIMDAKLAGEKFRIGVWTGASTAPELDGALAMVDGIELRLPYQSDPTQRKRINAGDLEYLDIHLSHVAQHAWFGFLGKLDVALIEVTAILEDGRLVPSSSIGNNKTWLDLADRVILEVNAWQPQRLEGMHDVYYGTKLPPHRMPVPILKPDDRIGDRHYRCDPEKIIAIVETNAPDRNTPFSPPDAVSDRIAGHILEFLAHEVKNGRMPETLLPMQSGVGNIANAVLVGLKDAPFDDLAAYTEVIQDGMLDLLVSGSGDFARNAYLSFFMTPSTAKNGAISCIVPMVSHVDHTEHDVQVLVTEHGLADLRGRSPKQRATLVIENCAHPDFRPALRDYYRRALDLSPGKHTPHLLGEAFSWHLNYLKTGRMVPN